MHKVIFSMKKKGKTWKLKDLIFNLKIEASPRFLKKGFEVNPGAVAGTL